MAKAPKTDQSDRQQSRPKRAASPPLRVLVVRHAIAEDPTDFARSGAPDADRPLTRQGRRRMRQAARGLSTLVPQVGTIASSPLVRAIETADVLVRRYRRCHVDASTLRLSALAPGKANNLLLDWLDEQPREKPVVLVGHEPHLGQFVSWALTGLRESFIELKKGAAVMLEFNDGVRPGRAKLLWALRPGQLRKIGVGGRR